eukprot:370062-Hanusia_phi.AAC.1
MENLRSTDDEERKHFGRSIWSIGSKALQHIAKAFDDIPQIPNEKLNEIQHEDPVPAAKNKRPAKRARKDSLLSASRAASASTASVSTATDSASGSASGKAASIEDVCKVV